MQKENNNSRSTLVENYLNAVAHQNNSATKASSPVENLTRVIDLEDADIKKSDGAFLNEKYS